MVPTLVFERGAFKIGPGGVLGARLAPFGSTLVPWVGLERPLGTPGASLGNISGASWPSLFAPGRLLGAPGTLLGTLGSIWDHLGIDLGLFWDRVELDVGQLFDAVCVCS